MQFYRSYGNNSWCCYAVVAPGGSWWLLVAPCGFWQLQVTPGGASGGDGFLVGLGGSWWVLASDGSS